VELQPRETRRDWPCSENPSNVQEAGSVTTLGTVMCFSSKQRMCHKLNLRNIRRISFVAVPSVVYIGQN